MVVLLRRRTETVLALATGVDGCTSGVVFVGAFDRPAPEFLNFSLLHYSMLVELQVLPPSIDPWFSRARTSDVVLRSACWYNDKHRNTNSAPITPALTN